MTQTVTQELHRWILEQTNNGCSRDTLYTSMVESGWKPDVAAQALDQTLAYLERYLAGDAEVLADIAAVTAETAAAGSAVAATAQPAMEAVPVPDAALSGSPRRLDGGDRMVDVIVAVGKPRVVVLGGLLSDEECDALIEAARPRLARSLTVETKTGGEEVNADRTSNGMFFTRGENELVQRIEARIAKLLNWPVENGEGIQVLNYQVGAEYKPHYDYFDPAEPGSATILKRGGQRVGTVVMYLNEPVRGGGTTFPDVGLEVAPVRGNAVFFSYDRAHPTTLSLHGGAPVLEGEKWVATKWMREGVFV